jgi:hypothetical protein
MIRTRRGESRYAFATAIVSDDQPQLARTRFAEPVRIGRAPIDAERRKTAPACLASDRDSPLRSQSPRHRLRACRSVTTTRKPHSASPRFHPFGSQAARRTCVRGPYDFAPRHCYRFAIVEDVRRQAFRRRGRPTAARKTPRQPTTFADSEAGTRVAAISLFFLKPRSGPSRVKFSPLRKPPEFGEFSPAPKEDEARRIVGRGRNGSTVAAARGGSG